MEENLPKPDIKEQIQTAPPAKKPMPKSLIALGITILVVAMLLIVFTILRNQRIQQINETTSSAVPQGMVTFTQESVQLDNKGEGSVDISISTGGQQIGGVVLSVKYNPKLLTGVKIENIKDPNSAISQSLVPAGTPQYDTSNGGALLSLQLPPQSPMSGKGVVARLYFKKSNLNVAVNSTEITFIANTNFITVTPGTIPLTKNQVTVSF